MAPSASWLRQCLAQFTAWHCRAGLLLVRTLELTQPLPGLKAGGSRVIGDGDHGDGVATNLTPDGKLGARRNTADLPQAKPLVGHLHDAGALF